MSTWIVAADGATLVNLDYVVLLEQTDNPGIIEATIAESAGRHVASVIDIAATLEGVALALHSLNASKLGKGTPE